MHYQSFIKSDKSSYIGLINQPLYINDNSQFSHDYFVLSVIPAELTSGINSFKIQANSNNLAIGSTIQIEILDSNRNPIEYKVSDTIDRLQRRLISILVYPHTSPGIGTITIVGIASWDVCG